MFVRFATGAVRALDVAVAAVRALSLIIFVDEGLVMSIDIAYERSVERMVLSGLPSMLIGGQRRFDPSQLHRYFARKNPALVRERARTPGQTARHLSSRTSTAAWFLDQYASTR